jgi:hypothetical protein
MTNKTPFELRYDLLAMAKDILTERLMGERMRLENDWQSERELSYISAQNAKEGDPVRAVPTFPKMPELSEDEIISMAAKLNEFVSNNKSGDNKND